MWIVGSGQWAVNIWPFFIPGVGACCAMIIYHENPFSEFVSIQTKDRHPGESRGPEHGEIPLWRNGIAAYRNPLFASNSLSIPGCLPVSLDLSSSRSTYFPITSVSMLTAAPMLFNPNVVIFAVWGIRLTSTWVFPISFTVRLTPSMAIDPF